LWISGKRFGQGWIHSDFDSLISLIKLGDYKKDFFLQNEFPEIKIDEFNLA
jgi:hypothetical protein